MSDSDLRVAIIGGGIGGLSLGLALRERGLRADVFEQAPELAEIGAAIALSANALREYARLGLVDELAAASTIPTELIYRHWRDGHRIAAHPVRKDNALISVRAAGLDGHLEHPNSSPSWEPRAGRAQPIERAGRSGSSPSYRRPSVSPRASHPMTASRPPLIAVTPSPMS